MNENIIYHYTDINALKSILTCGTLWMTSHKFLNDTQEFKDGFSRLKKSVDECMLKYDDRLHDDTKDSVSEMMSLLENTIILSTSFSKHADLLSQWRSYCPSQGGFAIGFDKECLGKLEGHSEFSPRLFECVYDEKEKNRLAKLFGEDAVLAHDRLEHFLKDKRMHFKSTIYYWLKFVIESKNMHFKEEDEVRFATYIQEDLNEVDIKGMSHSNYSAAYYPNGIKVFQNRPLSFRTKANILVPYFEYEFDLNAIKEIVIGPCANLKLVKESIEFFCKNLALDIDVKCSEIPYRNL